MTMLFISNSSFALNIKATGKFVIEKNNLREADKNAREEALLNALKTYFENSNDTSNMPEITTEFFKFIKSYKILERYVNNYTVYYTIEADIDEIAQNDLTHYLNSVSHSVVYILNTKNHETFKDIKHNTLDKVITDIFDSYSFSTKYQKTFQLKLSETPDLEEIMKQFSISKARYLYYIELEASCNEIDNQTSCNMNTISRIFTKEKNFTAIKAPSNTSSNNMTEALLTSFDKSINNTLKYVRENLIPLPEIKYEIQKISIIVINYKTFSSIKNTLKILKDKKIINNYNVQSYTSNKIIFNIETTFNQTQLISKIKSFNKNNDFSVENKETSIVMDFAPAQF